MYTCKDAEYGYISDTVVLGRSEIFQNKSKMTVKEYLIAYKWKKKLFCFLWYSVEAWKWNLSGFNEILAHFSAILAFGLKYQSGFSK